MNTQKPGDPWLFKYGDEGEVETDGSFIEDGDEDGYEVEGPGYDGEELELLFHTASGAGELEWVVEDEWPGVDVTPKPAPADDAEKKVWASRWQDDESVERAHLIAERDAEWAAEMRDESYDMDDMDDESVERAHLIAERNAEFAREEQAEMEALLRYAIQKGDSPYVWEHIARFSDEGAFLDPQGLNALQYSCAYGLTGSVKLILAADAAGADLPDAEGLTPLFYAAMGDDEMAMALLSSHGADLERRTPDGGTLAHMAAEWGSLKTLAFLSDAGLDLNALDRNGRRPVDVATDEARDALIRAGATSMAPAARSERMPAGPAHGAPARRM